MVRAVRDAQFGSRAARERLATGKRYWRAIDAGLHLGYRRAKRGTGSWVMRLYEGQQSYRTETIASADDRSDANGVDVLDFQQAQQEARRRRDERAHVRSG